MRSRRMPVPHPFMPDRVRSAGRRLVPTTESTNDLPPLRRVHSNPDDPASDVLPETGGTGEPGCRREGVSKCRSGSSSPIPTVRPGCPIRLSGARIVSTTAAHRTIESIDRHWPSASRAKAQPQTDNLGSLEVAGGQGGWMLFAHQPAMPAAIVGRRKRTGRARPAKATSKEGASSQQGAAPQHLQRSFTARQIGTASNEAFVRFDKKISRKKKSGLRHSTF